MPDYLLSDDVPCFVAPAKQAGPPVAAKQGVPDFFTFPGQSPKVGGGVVVVPTSTTSTTTTTKFVGVPDIFSSGSPVIGVVCSSDLEDDGSINSMTTTPTSTSDCPSWPNEKALLEAIKNLDIFTLRYLLYDQECPINPNQSLKTDGSAPMHFAAVSGFVEGIRELFLAGANPNTRNSNGESPLHFAAVSGNSKAVVTLVECGANLNATDNEGDTPLHFAVRESRKENVRALLQLGADPRISNLDGETPYRFATQIGEEAIAAVLRPRQPPTQSPSFFRFI